MFEYKRYMKDFDSNNYIRTLFQAEKKFVQVTHDECYFYANDRQQKI